MSNDCPNRCIDGLIINPYTHKREICLYCKDKREKEIESGDAIEKLNLPLGFTNSRFEADSVFPSYSSKYLDESSTEEVKKVMTQLVQDVSIGTKPSHSMLFNLGIKVVEDNFLCPLILKSYLSGLKTLPILDVATIRHKRAEYEEGVQQEGLTFTEMLEDDICVVSMDAGCDYRGILAVKGLMQLRARRGKATIILTHVWNKTVLDLCNEDENFHSLGLATLYSVKYIKKVEDTPNTGLGMSKAEFEAMKAHKNIL